MSISMSKETKQKMRPELLGLVGFLLRVVVLELNFWELCLLMVALKADFIRGATTQNHARGSIPHRTLEGAFRNSSRIQQDQ